MVLDDDEPLPPSAQPPTPGFGSRTTNVKAQSFISAGAALGGSEGGNGSSESNRGKDHGTLVAHRTVFFFKLEREIEKVWTSLHAVRCPPARGLTSKTFFERTDQRLLPAEGTRSPTSTADAAVKPQADPRLPPARQRYLG